MTLRMGHFVALLDALFFNWLMSFLESNFFPAFPQPCMNCLPEVSVCSVLCVLPLSLSLCVHVDSLSLYLCVDSKQYMAEAAALLDARRKRKVEERTSPPASKRASTGERKTHFLHQTTLSFTQ